MAELTDSASKYTNDHITKISSLMLITRQAFFICTLLLFSCTTTYPPVENPLDAGRQFADAIFNGNFERARQLIVPTEENLALLRWRLEEPYHQRNNTDRTQMAQASLQIQNVENTLKDSTLLIHFINAYDGKPAVMKVVKANGSWLVDLGYTFSGKK